MTPRFHLKSLASLAAILAIQCATGAGANAQSATDLRQLTAASRDVFEVLEDQDAVRHIQSGLICPRYMGGMTLTSAAPFPSPVQRGRDVGCDYSSADTAGATNGKLTIYATDYGAPMPADLVFEATRTSLAAIDPTLRPRDGMATFDLDGVTAYFEQFDAVINGVPSETSLSIAALDGWVVKVRRTRFPPDAVTADPGAAMAALSHAVSTISSGPE